MPYIRTIPRASATGRLAELYDKYEGDHTWSRLTALFSFQPELTEALRVLQTAVTSGRSRIDERRRRLIGTVVNALIDCKG